MNVAIYCRASTDLQEESIDTQLDMCREWCSREGHTIVKEYIDDGFSGGLECSRRPAASQMLVDARKRMFSGVVARSSRRLGRDTLDLLIVRKEAKKLKLSLFFCTQTFGEDAQGDFMWSMMASMGEFERKQTGERIKHHNRHLARIGRWPSGRPPLGYKYDSKAKTISINADRAADAIELFRTFAATSGNRRRTARLLNTAGVLTRDGNLWSDKAVACCIKAPLYRNIIRYEEIKTAIDIPALIPPDLLARVDLLLECTAHIRQHDGKRGIYPYSGILICAQCGNSFKVVKSKHRPNSYSYICRGRKDKGVCLAPRIGNHKLDAIVGDLLEEALGKELELIATDAAEVQGQTTQDVAVLAIAQKRRNLQEKREKLIDLYTSSIITKEDLESRIQALDSQMTTVIQPKPKAHLTALQIETMLENWSSRWVNLEDKTKRELLLLLCSKLYISRSDQQSVAISAETNLSFGKITLRFDGA